MTQEERELVIKDLCARLPYGVKTSYSGYKMTIRGVDVESKTVDVINWGKARFVAVRIEKIKPYLRPLSSMTEEENLSLAEFVGVHVSARHGEIYFPNLSDNTVCNWHKVFDWLNRNMFDYHGLIPAGLANAAPEGTYNN